MKDMGKVVAALKAKHGTQLDMSKASGPVKAALADGLRRALELDPGNVDEGVYLTGVFTDARRYAEAEALARRLADAFPERLDVSARLAANALFARGSDNRSAGRCHRQFECGARSHAHQDLDLDGSQRGSHADGIAGTAKP